MVWLQASGLKKKIVSKTKNRYLFTIYSLLSLLVRGIRNRKKSHSFIEPAEQESS